MKFSRRHEVAFIFGGVLLGLGAGVFGYEAFFLPPHTDRNGFAELFAGVCLMAGSLCLSLTRAEKHRLDRAGDNPDT
jgi:hypothetical protein